MNQLYGFGKPNIDPRVGRIMKRMALPNLYDSLVFSQTTGH